MLSATGDFNADGRDDLAIGLPEVSVNAWNNAGEVRVRYGTANGLNEDSEQVWTLDSRSVNGHARAGDGFGSSLAVGDFNNDGYDDLAVGIPGRMVSGHQAAGAVTILFGSRSGLRASGDQQWSQDSLGINSHARANENFGTALAVGDFDNDGYGDLAIGTPGESTAGVVQAGIVNVIFGSRSGLKRSQDQIVRHRDEFWLDLPSHRTDSKFFGSVLATGDFNGDGYDDLAISMRERIALLDDTIDGDPTSDPMRGGVDIYHGVEYGIEISVATNVDSRGKLAPENMLGPDGDDYFFGAALAVGNFDGNEFDDLAIGVPGELTQDWGPIGSPPTTYIGAVRVIYGSENGLHFGARTQTFTPKDFILTNNLVATTDEGFGRSLAASSFDHWGGDDLAIGMDLANVSGQLEAGKGAVVHSTPRTHWTNTNPFPIELPPDSPGGLLGAKFVWHQDISGILDDAESNDRFGAALVTGDFDGNGMADLAIGVSGEDIAGATAVLYAYPQDFGPILQSIRPWEVYVPSVGLTPKNNQLWLYNAPVIVRE